MRHAGPPLPAARRGRRWRRVLPWRRRALGSTPPARRARDAVRRRREFQPGRRAPAPRSAARPAAAPPGGACAASVALSERPGGRATVQLGATTEFGSRAGARRGRAARRLARRGHERSAPTAGSPGSTARPPVAALRAHALVAARRPLGAHARRCAATGARVHRLRVAIGRPGSPTPTGRFAVTDKLAGERYGSYYGCCILALNGHQPNPPPGWTGGNRLAIHGTDAPAHRSARAASAGCLRAADADLRVLMAQCRSARRSSSTPSSRRRFAALVTGLRYSRGVQLRRRNAQWSESLLAGAAGRTRLL